MCRVNNAVSFAPLRMTIDKDRFIAGQNAPSCVKLKPGRVTPSANLETFTFTTGASGAVTSAGRSTANCENTSLYTLVTR